MIRAIVLLPEPLSPTRLVVLGGSEVSENEARSTATSSPPIALRAPPWKDWVTSWRAISLGGFIATRRSGRGAPRTVAALPRARPFLALTGHLGCLDGRPMPRAPPQRRGGGGRRAR